MSRQVREAHLGDAFIALQIDEHAALREREPELHTGGVTLEVARREARDILEQEIEIAHPIHATHPRRSVDDAIISHEMVSADATCWDLASIAAGTATRDLGDESRDNPCNYQFLLLELTLRP